MMNNPRLSVTTHRQIPIIKRLFKVINLSESRLTSRKRNIPKKLLLLESEIAIQDPTGLLQ